MARGGHLTTAGADPNSKLARFHNAVVRRLRNPASCRQEEDYETGVAKLRMPDSWRFTKLFQVGIGMYFIIAFVLHTNSGGSIGIWPTVLIGALTIISCTYCIVLLLRPYSRSRLPNYTIALSIVDLGFATASLILCFWMSSFNQYHWYQCHFYWWGRSCRLQRYQNAAMFLHFFSHTVTAGVALHVVRRLRARHRSLASGELPYSRVPSAPEHDANKYSNVPFIPRTRRNSSSDESSTEGARTPREQRGLLVPIPADVPPRSQSRSGFKAHDSDSDDFELAPMER